MNLTKLNSCVFLWDAKAHCLTESNSDASSWHLKLSQTGLKQLPVSFSTTSSYMYPISQPNLVGTRCSPNISFSAFVYAFLSTQNAHPASHLCLLKSFPLFSRWPNDFSSTKPFSIPKLLSLHATKQNFILFWVLHSRLFLFLALRVHYLSSLR